MLDALLPAQPFARAGRVPVTARIQSPACMKG